MREYRYDCAPDGIDAPRDYLAQVARQRDAAFGRLKAFVEG